MNPKIDEYLEKIEQWNKELSSLRKIVLSCGLDEELKWGVPCYVWKNSNILILGNFKEYCCLSFFKGVLLNDENNILVAPGENSQSVRMFKFSNVEEIKKYKNVIKTYIYEAIEIEKAGLKVVKKDHSEIELVSELKEMLNQNLELKRAFESLTPGRQRGYNIFISAAKQSSTRISRVKQYEQRILNGKGINDCICGHSKRMPTCDGSHNKFN